MWGFPRASHGEVADGDHGDGERLAAKHAEVEEPVAQTDAESVEPTGWQQPTGQVLRVVSCSRRSQ